jgi:hypothetical protein
VAKVLIIRLFSLNYCTRQLYIGEAKGRGKKDDTRALLKSMISNHLPIWGPRPFFLRQKLNEPKFRETTEIDGKEVQGRYMDLLCDAIGYEN